MNMKKYIEPAIKVKEIELEDMIAASPVLPANEDLDTSEDGTITSSEAIESKKYGNVSVWDE